MTDPADHEAITFASGECATCERVVIGAHDLIDDQLQIVCSHCDTLLERVEWIDSTQADQMGYFVEGAPVRGQTRRCGGGACGVRQPDEFTR